MRLIALVLTMALHAALLASALVRCDDTQAKPLPPPPETKRGDEVLDVKLLPSAEGDGPPCDFYTGVGVRRSFMSDMILEVVAGGPAERAGVQVDDVWLNQDEFYPDLYPVGTRMVMRVQRGAAVLELPVVIGRICQEK